jgi:hypothetical protein
VKIGVSEVMRSRMTNEYAFEVLGSIIAMIHHEVPRREYDDLLTTAYNLYRENNELRYRLSKLESLASSWAGNPELHPEIRMARKLLAIR